MPQTPRSTPAPTIEQVLLALLFLAAVLVLSLPAVRETSAGFGWMPLWLLALPAVSLGMAVVLRRRGGPVESATPMAARRRRTSSAVVAGAMVASARRRPLERAPAQRSRSAVAR